MSRIFPIALLVSIAIALHAAAAGGDEEGKIVNDADRRWLEARLEKIVAQTRNKLPDGATIYSAGGYGPHVWARDMYYIVSAARRLVPADEVGAVVELFIKHQRPDGSTPKGISARGQPSYAVWNVPGGFDSLKLPLDRKSPVWSSQNPRAEGDSAQFVVLLAYEYFDRTGDKRFVAKNLPALVRAMDSMPRGRRGLIWIDPQNPHTSYGFTDNVAKTGEELFCSLLYWEAARRLAEMARAVDRPEIARDFTARAELIEQNIDRLKDENTGLYFAAGELGRQIDVWGNAYLVYSGFPDAARRRRISRFLAANQDAYVFHGQIRHLLKPDYWQKTFRWPTGGDYPRDRYQNGGYWGTASGWVIYAIAQTDRRAAARMMSALVNYYRQNGVYEWINEEGAAERPDYAASVANPFSALRRLRPPR
ncbi:MAG: hypothetical protein JW959_14530 [Pirellulales bacterium]|nr:hypothetical protein [Pirellulales bacterium]